MILFESIVISTSLRRPYYRNFAIHKCEQYPLFRVTLTFFHLLFYFFFVQFKTLSGGVLNEVFVLSCPSLSSSLFL